MYDYQREKVVASTEVSTKITYLEGDLKNIGKVQAFEDAMVELGEYLAKNLSEFRAKVRKTAKTYEAMVAAEFDDEYLDEFGFITPTGDEAIDLESIGDIVQNSKQLKGATQKLKLKLETMLAKAKKEAEDLD